MSGTGRYEALNQTTQQLDEADRLKRAEQRAAALESGSTQQPTQSVAQETQKSNLKELSEAMGTSPDAEQAYYKARDAMYQELINGKKYTPQEANYILNREEQGTAIPQPQDPLPRNQGQSADQRLTRAAEALDRAIERANALEERVGQKQDLNKTQEQGQDVGSSQER